MHTLLFAGAVQQAVQGLCQRTAQRVGGLGVIGIGIIVAQVR